VALYIFQKIQKILTVDGITFSGTVNENLFYDYMTKICKMKNLEDNPLCSKIKKIFEQKSYDQLGWIDSYSEPIYKWEINQQDHQIYNAIKI
jgi:hypothetical protein